MNDDEDRAADHGEERHGQNCHPAAETQPPTRFCAESSPAGTYDRASAIEAQLRFPILSSRGQHGKDHQAE